MAVAGRVVVMLAAVKKLLGRRLAGGRSGPAVEYVRILDGESIWVSVLGAGENAAIGLQPDDGPAVPLVDDSGHERDQEGRLAVRCRLDGVLPDRESHGDLVLLDRKGRASPLGVGPDALGTSTVMRIPVSADGRWQHGLGDQGGSITVHRRAARPAVDLVSAFEQSDAIAIDVRLPRDDAEPTLVLVKSDDEGVEYGTVAGEPQPEAEGALPVAAPGEHVVRFRVVDSDVPDEPGLTVRAYWQGPQGRRPVRRHRNDLKDISAAVNRPTLFTDASQEEARMRLRFGAEGLVLLRRLKRGEVDQ